MKVTIEGGADGRVEYEGPGVLVMVRHPAGFVVGVRGMDADALTAALAYLRRELERVVPGIGAAADEIAPQLPKGESFIVDHRAGGGAKP